MTSIVIVPSRVHFTGEEAIFEAKRGKNPNFREMKQDGRKRELGGL